MILFLSREEGYILGDVYIVKLPCDIDSCDVVLLHFTRSVAKCLH